MPGPGRRAADLRRVRLRHRDLRRAHPAADEDAGATSRRSRPEGRGMSAPVSYFPVDDPAARRLPARPEPIMIRPTETALIVVDMQNAYACPAAISTMAGFDVAGARRVIEKIAQAAAAARRAGVTVIYFQNGWDPDYVEAGGPGSPNWHKSNALKTMRAQARTGRQAAGQGRLGLRPGRRADAAARRHRHPASRATAPSSTPTSTACCARAASARWSSPASRPMSASRSTLRDGFHLEYFGVVLEDATHHAGPAFVQEAALYNIEKFFGWVSNDRRFLRRPVRQAPNPMPDRGKALMPMKAIIPPGTGKTLAPFSPGTLADGVVYVSGHAGLRQGQQRRPCRRRRRRRPRTCWRPSSR